MNTTETPKAKNDLAKKWSQWMLNELPRQALLCVIDDEGVILECNERLLNVCEAETEDVVGSSFFRWFRADSFNDTVKRIEAKLLIGLPWHGYLRWRKTESASMLLQTTIMCMNKGEKEKPVFLCQQFVVDPQELYIPETTQHELVSRMQILERMMAVIEFDLKGNILDANDNFLHTAGYSKDEVRGQHHRIFMHPEDAASPEYAEMWEKLGQGQTLSGVFRRRRKDGRTIWIMGSYNPVLDAQGKPYKLIKHVMDVTHQKELELELQNAVNEQQAQEEELRQNMEEITAINDEVTTVQSELKSVLEGIGRTTAVIEFDLNGHIQKANDNFLKTVGYEMSEIQGKHHRIFMPETDAARPEYAAMWKQLGEGKPLSGVFHRVRKDGQSVWIMGSYNPIFDKNGKPYKLVKYVLDVTKEKRQEIELQQTLMEKQAQEEELRQNMDEISAINDEMSHVQRELSSVLAGIDRTTAVIEFDLKGHIRTANSNFLQAVGYDMNEIQGQHHRTFMFPEDSAKEEYAEMWQQLADGKPISGVFRRRRKDGKALWIMGSYNPILDADGKPYKLIKYVLDVTKQKELEIELQSTLMEKQAQEEELRQNMEEISAINDEMGHVQMELRSVLEGIGRTTAVIEFDLKGNIQHANDNFLNAMGYELNEIADKHHRIFMDEADAAGAEYAEMWQQLNEGKPLTGVFRRRHKNGSRIWIMGSYNPIFDRNGKPYKLVKYVMDVTKAKEQEIELQQALMEKQAQEEELRQNMEEISAINDEMHDKNIVIEDLNRDLKANNLQLAIAKEKLEVRMNDVQLEIKESIRYAQRIQRALIPAPERLNQDIPANFHAGVLFIPRDIVSGDFYWAGPVSDGRIMLAVGDGTGHGVPGSFMSLLGVTTLQKHLEKGLTDPAEILFAMNKDLQALLAQQHGEVLDSIEMILISLNPDGSDLRYASAMRPLYLVENEKLTELEFSRHSVGGRPVQGETINFRTFELNINLGACLYLMSDGLQDQFGGFGDKAKKWSRLAMKDAITRLTSEVPLRKRAAALARLHTDWRGYFIDQTDDICCLMLELETVKAK